MARRNLEVVVTVRDAASQPLDKINKKVKGTGEAANQANLDFTKFNKTLFTTAAFIGTFVKGFNALRTSLDQGAELDRLSNQYERVLGPKGKLFQALDNVTTTTIDKTTALQEGLKLANLGIVKDQEQLAEILGKAGTAAKMAGLDSGEGVKRFSDFLASGSVGQLEFLGLIARTNPALQAQMAILSKAGGVMGGVISTQAKLALGMNLLNAATKNQLHQTRDLVDIMALAKTNFTYLRGEMGRFLGTALGPVIEKLSMFMFQMATTIDNIRRNSKELVFLAKAVIMTTGAILGLTGALGTLRLMVKLLSFAGIGIPGLTFAVTTLAGAFLGITQPVDGIMKKLELFGGFVKGVWELITNLDPETGLSKMSKGTYNMLKKAGILDFAMMVARLGATLVRVGKDIYESVVKSFQLLDQVVGGFFHNIFNFFSNFTKDWTTWWTSDAISGVEKFARAAMVIIGALGAFFAAKGIFKLFSAVISKIPILGKFFGGGGGGKGSGPSGSPTDPIYTVPVGAGLLGGGAGGGLFGGLLGGLKDWVMKAGKNLALNLAIIVMNLGTWLRGLVMALAGPLIQAGTAMFTAIGPLIAPALAVAAAAALGVAIGKGLNVVLDKYTQGKTSEGYEGNILERGLFKLSNLTGIGPGRELAEQMKRQQEFQSKSDAQIVNEMRAKQGKPPLTPEQEARLNNKGAGKVSPVTIPYNADDEITKIDSLGGSLKDLSGAQQAQQQTAIENALATNSANGAVITPDEMAAIMNPGINYLKQISENTAGREQNMSTPASRR